MKEIQNHTLTEPRCFHLKLNDKVHCSPKVYFCWAIIISENVVFDELFKIFFYFMESDVPLLRYSFFFLFWTIPSTSKLNPLSANPKKWSNTLKQFVDRLQTNCLSVFDHFVALVLKGLIHRDEYQHSRYSTLLNIYFESQIIWS